MGIARYIDHTALKPDTSLAQVRQLCGEAKEHGFASVCVNPVWVNVCVDLLGGTDVKVCTVIGFPLGANMPEVKAVESSLAVQQGASEVDMVLNIGALKSRNLELVMLDIRAVRRAVPDAVLKVIIETCLLTDKEKVIACQIVQQERADFVKTSTGFASGGATIEDIVLMRRTVGDLMSVNASGGIRTFMDAQAMIQAGANRIGCSAGVAIVRGEQGVSGY